MIGDCDCCGRIDVEVRKIPTTVTVVYMCMKCLAEMADLYLGSEGV
jgi:hypothetical protein